MLHQLATAPTQVRRRGRWRRSDHRDATALAAILAQRSLTLPTLGQERTIAHRLIQRVLRDRSQQAGRLDAVLIAAATAVEATAEHASQRWHERARLAEYAEHANALLTHPTDAAAREQIVQLLGRLVYLLNEAHTFATSVTVGTDWVAECERVLGPDHRDTFALRNNFARAYRAVGRLDEAVHLYTRTLADACEEVGWLHEAIHVPSRAPSLTSRSTLRVEVSEHREDQLGHWLLAEHPHGFNGLDRSIEGISRRMLIRTLGGLDEAGSGHRPGVSTR